MPKERYAYLSYPLLANISYNLNVHFFSAFFRDFGTGIALHLFSPDQLSPQNLQKIKKKIKKRRVIALSWFSAHLGTLFLPRVIERRFWQTKKKKHTHKVKNKEIAAQTGYYNFSAFAESHAAARTASPIRLAPFPGRWVQELGLAT